MSSERQDDPQLRTTDIKYCIQFLEPQFKRVTAPLDKYPLRREMIIVMHL